MTQAPLRRTITVVLEVHDAEAADEIWDNHLEPRDARGEPELIAGCIVKEIHEGNVTVETGDPVDDGCDEESPADEEAPEKLSAPLARLVVVLTALIEKAEKLPAGRDETWALAKDMLGALTDTEQWA